jgi:hypothetical protein
MRNLAPIPMPLFPSDFSRRWSGGRRALRNQLIGPIGPTYPNLFTRDRHAWVRGPLARMPSLPREMPPGQATLKTSRSAATWERAWQGTPEERAGGPRTQGASPYLSGRFANHPDEPCRRRTSIDSARGMRDGFTAPTGRRIPAQGEPLGIRGKTSQAF